MQKASANDRIEATWYSGTSFSLDLNLTDGATHQVAFYSLDYENAGRSQKVDILDAQTGATLDSQSISGFSGGRYLVWNLSGHVTVRFTSTGAKNAVLSGVFFGSGLGNTAQFAGFDTTTLGNWKGVYGADGYQVVSNAASYPGYATVTPSNFLSWTWADPTNDPRGLQKVSSASDRIEATWYSPATLTVDLEMVDGKSHRVAFYCLDYENAGRAQTVTILDTQTRAVLDTRTLSNFSSGQYMIWNLSGRVSVQFTRTGPKNSVLSGIFFK